jgi:hypothetical protein
VEIGDGIWHLTGSKRPIRLGTLRAERVEPAICYLMWSAKTTVAVTAFAPGQAFGHRKRPLHWRSETTQAAGGHRSFGKGNGRDGAKAYDGRT